MSKRIYSTFSDFSNLAKSEIQSSHKIGFDENTRPSNIDKVLVNDMFKKVGYLLNDNLSEMNILDIGCGCSYFTNFLIDHSILNKNRLYLIDSKEMLSNIDDTSDNVTKISGKFPMSNGVLRKLEQKVNLIIINSVLHHVLLEDSIFQFLENSLKYLEHFGILYIGDLPNASMQNRQVENYNSKKFKKHKIHGEGRFNDSLVLSLISYFRGKGFNAYIMPKPTSYKFSHSREDLIITRI